MLANINTLKTVAQNCIEKIEATPLSFGGWLFGLLSVAMVRVFIENTSHSSYSGFIGLGTLGTLHLLIFFLCTYLSIVLTLSLFLKKEIVKIVRVLFIFFPLIWIPPIVDHISSALFGTGRQMAYLFQGSEGLVRNFFSFYGDQYPGLTVGVRVEIILVLLLSFLYVVLSTKRVWKGLAALGTLYCVLFFLAAIPSLPALLGGTESVSLFYTESISGSLLEKNLVGSGMIFLSPLQSYEMYSTASITSILYFLTVILSGVIAWKIDRRKFLAVVKNSRFSLFGHHMILLIIFGVLLAVLDGNPFPHLHWLNIIYILTAFLASVFSWLFATSINDLYDTKGDALTNTKRPLITKELSLEDMKNFSIAFLVLSLAGGFLAGSYIFFLVLTANALVYLYSSPPFRLKRIPLLNPFLIATSLLVAVLGGYYAVSIDQHIAVFPKKIFLLVVAVYLLWANIKDLKDFAGDKVMNSYTLPVIFGMEKAKKIIGVMAFAGFLLFPLILGGGVVFWAVSLLFGITSFALVQRKIFSLSRLYALILLYFAFLFFGALILIGNRPTESPANISTAEQEFLENAQNKKVSADPENTAAALAEMMRQMILNAQSAPTP